MNEVPFTLFAYKKRYYYWDEVEWDEWPLMELEGEGINYKQLLKRLNFPRSTIDKTSCKLYWQSMRAYMYVIAFQTLRAMDEWNGIRIKKCKQSRKNNGEKYLYSRLPNQLQSSQKIFLASGLKSKIVSLRIWENSKSVLLRNKYTIYYHLI